MTSTDRIAERAVHLARTFGISTDIANGHKMYSLVDNAERANQMCIITTTDGDISIRIGDNLALRRSPKFGISEVYNGFEEELARRFGLALAQEVEI
ncbi:MAG: hypothetical protein ABFE08_19900 [Armatimonadia bacterium]